MARNGCEDQNGLIPVHVMQGRGYVWRAQDAYRLRDEFGIIGAMVGGITAFKQQNAVRGVPLQLSPEEVTYLLKEVAVVRLYSMKAHADGIRSRGTEHSISDRKSNFEGNYDSDEASSSTDSDDGDPDANKWQHALANGTEFLIPLEPETEGEEISWDIEWLYPENTVDIERYAVFRDLKRRKYCITAGSKFGADYLLYPGDPTLFHAQFCVRIMPIDVPVVPSRLAAACRGSFQARKHLLYASIDEGGHVVYTTFGQIGGFG